MVNEAFEDPLFWQLYYYLEECLEFPNDVVARHLKALAKDVSVETSERIEFATAHFNLPLGHSYEMHLSIMPHELVRTIKLALRDIASGEEARMAWCEHATWTPYCLRAEELDLLLHYWSRHGPTWCDDRIALLLIAPFVGQTDANAADHLADRVNTAYRDLCAGVDAHAWLNIQINQDYRWTHDDELGWLFTGEHARHSIRNREHLGSELFPFARFNAVMKSIAATA